MRPYAGLLRCAARLLLTTTSRPTAQFPTRGKVDAYATEDDYREWSGEDEHSEDDAPPCPDLTDLRQAVAAAIDELGGAVIPKLTWSCPKARGASWHRAPSLVSAQAQPFCLRGPLICFPLAAPSLGAGCGVGDDSA